MKSKIAMLLFSFVLFCGCASAFADESLPANLGSGEWEWTASAGSNSIVFDLKSSILPAGSSFSFVGKDKTVTLIDSTKSADFITIDSKFIAQITTNTTTGLSFDSAALNNDASSATFKFIFSDGTTDLPTYSVTKEALAAGGVLYNLFNSQTGMKVSFITTAAPSAVPIPGSALLLGSSLLGLVGISTRKKKA